MELKQYLTEAEKQYHLRLKTIVPLDDATMDRIERYLAKYDPVSVSRPKRTILQKAPLDFPNVTEAEVYIVDMAFGLPAAPHVLRADIRKLLDAPESYVFVRTRNDPGEVENARMNALADMALEADRRGLRPADLLTDSEYGEADRATGLFGTDYNMALVNYLISVEHERRKTVEHVQGAPFRWLPVAERDHYNAEIPEAPFVAFKPTMEPIEQHMMGNIDSLRGEMRRTYLDKEGNRVVLTRKLGEVY